MSLWGFFKPLRTHFKAERIVKVAECLVVVFPGSHFPLCSGNTNEIRST